MENYTLWKSLLSSGTDIGFFKEFYVYFYQAFIENDRWLQYLQGVGTTLITTAFALILGVVLGVIVASIRTAHDQQRTGPVSYTHLDVYKRQHPSCLGKKCVIGWVNSKAPERINSARSTHGGIC